MEGFGWCFIGTGTLARKVAKQLLESGRHRIVSCHTRDYAKGEAFAEEFGCTAYYEAGGAIGAEGVQGVYVVTPHNAHHRFARLALEMGKSVLCEKPFTVNARDTDDLISLARSRKVYLCEAMWTWFSPVSGKVRQWVETGRIGKVTEASFTYHLKSIGYAPRVSDPRKAGGALLDITIYPITYAYRLWGKPDEIECTAVMDNGIDLGEDIVFTYGDGNKVRISASIMDFKGYERMRIRGDKGTIRATLYHYARYATCRNGLFRKEVFRLPHGNGVSYLLEFDTVADEINEGLTESRMVPLEATSDVMHILDDIRERIGLSYPDLE